MEEKGEMAQLECDNIVPKEGEVTAPIESPIPQAHSTTSEPLGKLVANEWNFSLNLPTKTQSLPFGWIMYQAWANKLVVMAT